MARQTSVISYKEIKDNGLLGKLKFQVYDYLYSNGPLTARQIDAALRSETQGSGCFTTRLSELREQGVVREVGKTCCPVSGRTAILWDVTDQLPKAVPPKETAKQKIARLEKEIARLTRTNNNLRDLCEDLERDRGRMGTGGQDYAASAESSELAR